MCGPRPTSCCKSAARRPRFGDLRSSKSLCSLEAARAHLHARHSSLYVQHTGGVDGPQVSVTRDGASCDAKQEYVSTALMVGIGRAARAARPRQRGDEPRAQQQHAKGELRRALACCSCPLKSTGRPTSLSIICNTYTFTTSTPHQHEKQSSKSKPATSEQADHQLFLPVLCALLHTTASRLHCSVRSLQQYHLAQTS